MRRSATYVPAALLIVGCAFLARMRAQVAVPLTAPLTTVLGTLPGYTVENVILSADEQRVAGMSEYVARVFRRDTTVAFTTFVSYYDRQSQGRTIHSPRNCLPGAGWEIVRAGVRNITAGEAQYAVNRDVLKNRNSSALVYYWYQGRGRVVASEYTVKWNLLRDAALLGHSEEALVRIVIPVPASTSWLADGSPAIMESDSAATRIATQLIEAVSKVLPPRSAVGS